MTREEVISKHLNKLSDRIKETLKEKGIDNTGAAADSLEVDGNKLLGADYMYFLDQGRGPGRFPPVDNLRDWVRSKLGLQGKEADSVAYLIGRSIAEGKKTEPQHSGGTSIFRDKSKGIELDSLIDEMLDELFKELADVEALEVLKWL